MDDFAELAKKDWTFLVRGPFETDTFGNFKHFEDREKILQLRRQYLDDVLLYYKELEDEQQLGPSSGSIDKSGLSGKFGLSTIINSVSRWVGNDWGDTPEQMDSLVKEISKSPVAIEWAQGYIRNHSKEDVQVSDICAVEYAKRLMSGHEMSFVDAQAEMMTEEIRSGIENRDYTLKNKMFMSILENNKDFTLGYFSSSDYYYDMAYILSTPDENGIVKVMASMPAPVLEDICRGNDIDLSERFSLYIRDDLYGSKPAGMTEYFTQVLNMDENDRDRFLQIRHSLPEHLTECFSGDIHRVGEYEEIQAEAYYDSKNRYSDSHGSHTHTKPSRLASRRGELEKATQERDAAKAALAQLSPENDKDMPNAPSYGEDE